LEGISPATILQKMQSANGFTLLSKLEKTCLSNGRRILNRGGIAVREFLIPLAGGLGVFLFGLALMRHGLETLALPYIQKLLARLTVTPWRGFLTGTLAAAVLHSSGAVTMLAVGFVGAGVLPFAQTIGLILGANVGTTITLEMLTLPIDAMVLPGLVIGIGLLFFPAQKVRPVGAIAAGISLLFIGLAMMRLIAEPLTQHLWFGHGLSWASRHLTFSFLFGLLITAVFQSSTAAIALLMGLMSAGELSMAAGIAYVLGSNVGTCATALLAALTGGAEAKKVALAHLLLNLAGAVILFPLIPWYADHVAVWGGAPATQIAHAQLLFNLLCSLAVLPWARQFAACVQWVYRQLF